MAEAAHGETYPLEVSIVMPCLNEADTLAICIEKAQLSLRENKIVGEIIVADNGSTDDSQIIAASMGTRIVKVETKGYGNALRGGIEAAAGKFIIMGDADDSYDFLDIPRFVAKLREGFDLVQGCRLSSGGGKIVSGAMPFLHQWIGNPLFSFMAKRMFRSPVNDIYCGMRGFTKKIYNTLDLRCTGMEYATEMIIKASLYDKKVCEIPITLYPDGRKSHPPHLKTFNDGWRTLRFFLMYSPRWLFLIPGMLFILLGIIGYGVAMPGVTVMSVTFDAHTLMFASLFILLGYQSILFAIFTMTFAINEGLMPWNKYINRFFELINLEKGLLAGSGSMFIGVVLLFIAVNKWRLINFGDMDYPQTMRLVIPGVLLTALGIQTIFSSFFVSILGMHRK